MSAEPLWEVFVRSRNGLSHAHVGSLHAADAMLALNAARDVYTRRGEGTSIWVVRSSDIHASDPDDKDALFEPALDKTFRQATYFQLPDEVKNL
jgi:ring-1,2-phenylacetyl-CoA epoxidase subunit PaaB